MLFKYKHLILLLPALINAAIDFEALAPDVPTTELKSYDETTGYPGDGNNGDNFYLPPKKGNNYDYESIAKAYLKEIYPKFEFEKTSIITFKKYYSVIINFVQVNENKKINNSYVKVSIDKRIGRVIDTVIQIWDNIEFKISNRKRSDEDFEKEIISSTKDLNDLLSLLEKDEADNIDWDDVKVERIDDESFLVNNVPYSYDNSAIVRHINTVKGSLGLNIFEYTFLYDNYYVIVSYNYDEKKVISAVQLKDGYSYDTFPFSSVDGYNVTTVYDPANKDLSPIGWHQINDNIYSEVTIGNNGRVMDESTGYTLNGGAGHNFQASLCVECDNYYANRDLSLSTTFYFLNMLHDIYYNLGFDEEHGNFQENNFGKGGKGNDGFIIRSNDCDSKWKKCDSIAATSTVRDGFSPVMYLSVISTDSNIYGMKHVDAGLSSHIFIHEYTHGVTHRLTGGPEYDCMNSDYEYGALNEGYSDFFSEALQYKKRDNYNRNTLFSPDKIVSYGNYITSDFQYNKVTYESLNDCPKSSPHCGGSVWKTMLHEVFWNIVEKYKDRTEDDYTKCYDMKKTQPYNFTVLRIILQGMAESGCNPTFIRARNKIIKAVTLNEETYGRTIIYCLFWKGFADRGLGINATEIDEKNKTYENNFEIPSNCKKYF